jgi:GxxExxY protein
MDNRSTTNKPLTISNVSGKLLHAELSYAVKGAALEVHKILGPGYLESVYEEAFSHELGLRKIVFERQKPLTAMYKGIVAGRFIADLIIENKILVELKAIKILTKTDEAQLMNYLRATGI